MGSVHGTYMNVSNLEPTRLKRGQNFVIGTDIFFNITDAGYSKKQYADDVSIAEDFGLFLATEEASGTKLHGHLPLLPAPTNKTLPQGPVTPPFPYSFVRAEIVTASHSERHIFVTRGELDLEYKLGRA